MAEEKSDPRTLGHPGALDKKVNNEVSGKGENERKRADTGSEKEPVTPSFLLEGKGEAESRTRSGAGKESEQMSYRDYEKEQAEERSGSAVPDEAENYAPSSAGAEAASETAVRKTEEPVQDDRNAGKTARPKTKKKKDSRAKDSLRSAGHSISRAWRVAGIVLACVILVLAVIGVIGIVDFVKKAKGDMDTPQEAGKTLVRVLKEDDFAAYQALLADENTGANDKALFESLQSSLDNEKETIVSNFILIRLENGKQFLCSIFFDEDKGEYVIRSVQEVPLAMQNIFVAK